MITHYAKSSEATACDIPRRNESGHLAVSWHRLAVTCEACKNTPLFRASRQQIPYVQGGPYRG